MPRKDIRWQVAISICTLVIQSVAVAFDVPQANAHASIAAERKASLVARHPLFGRTIERSELPALLQLVTAAWKLPISTDTSIAYLIQGEENTSAKEDVMWSACGKSDAYVLTFRSHRADALFFPNSRLAEGRNVLLAAAALEELRRGYRYRYYVMLDGDVYASQPWAEALQVFEEFLVEWAPAVGMPAYGNSPFLRPGERLPQAVFHFDHIFLAVHAEAASALLPYRPELDQECAWVSQWIFTTLAQALYRSHTLVFPAVHVFNPEHGDYPREDCYVHMKKASMELRKRAPPSARKCFTDPAMARFLFTNAFGPNSYVPWATAMKKVLNNSSVVDYSSASLSAVAPCDENVEELHRQAMPRVSRFCPGCPPEAIIYLLQTNIADNPLWGPNWHELSITMWGTMGDLPLARGCVEIARRLEELRGNDEPAVHDLIGVLDPELRQRGLENIADQFSSSWLWTEERGRAIVMKVIRVALLSIHYADADDPLLMSSDELDWLVNVLCGDQLALANRPKRRPTPFGLMVR